MSEWYLSHNGKKTGPLSAKQIARLVAGGAFRADEALVWKEGMAEWQSIADVGLVAESSYLSGVEPSPLKAILKSNHDPFKTQEPESRSNDPSSTSPAIERSLTPLEAAYAEVNYEGMGRLAFILSPLLLFICALALLFVLKFSLFILGIWFYGEKFVAYLGLAGLVVLSVAILIATVRLNVSRFRNLGMSGWWTACLMVPFLNIWLQWRQYACPAGYADHKKLDSPGIIITVFYVIIHSILLLYGIDVLLEDGAQKFRSPG